MDTSTLNITGLFLGLTTLILVFFPMSGKGHSIKNVPLLLVAIGFLSYFLGFDILKVSPNNELGSAILLVISEALVVVALASAGLSVKTPPTWRQWKPAYLLLLVTMPLMIVGCFFSGSWILGFGFSSALLLGAVLAPTDPVLARAVQVDGPGSEGEECATKLALTAEAGLNDGLAFPFVYLAIACAGVSSFSELGAEAFTNWFLVKFLYKVLMGVLFGAAFGAAAAALVERFKASEDYSNFFGLLVVGAVTTSYFASELLGGYGFLAVFVSCVAARRVGHQEKNGEDLELPHAFTDQIEILVTSLMLVWLGIYVAREVVFELSALKVIFSLLVVGVLRPLFAGAALVFSGLKKKEIVATSVLGVKGLGSIYYLSYAVGTKSYSNEPALWRVTALIILISIVFHGFASGPLLKWAEGE